jgi:Raf kinase inhibitor-like YbhB/YbcL family protein
MDVRWFGRLLSRVRAGDRHSAWNHAALFEVPEVISLRSDWFDDGRAMPLRAAGKGVGENVSPPLSWDDAPDGTTEFALIMEDPDAPLPRPFVHLIAYGIPGELRQLPEGALGHEGPSLRFGKSTIGSQAYMGPRPMPAHGPHRYVIQILALNRPTKFQSAPNLKSFLKGVSGTVIGRGRLIGTFERQ